MWLYCLIKRIPFHQRWILLLSQGRQGLWIKHFGFYLGQTFGSLVDLFELVLKKLVVKNVCVYYVVLILFDVFAPLDLFLETLWDLCDLVHLVWDVFFVILFIYLFNGLEPDGWQGLIGVDVLDVLRKQGNVVEDLEAKVFIVYTNRFWSIFGSELRKAAVFALLETEDKFDLVIGNSFWLGCIHGRVSKWLRFHLFLFEKVISEMIGLNIGIDHIELASIEVFKWKTRCYLINIIVLTYTRPICQVHNQLTVVKELPKLLWVILFYPEIALKQLLDVDVFLLKGFLLQPDSIRIKNYMTCFTIFILEAYKYKVEIQIEFKLLFWLQLLQFFKVYVDLWNEKAKSEFQMLIQVGLSGDPGCLVLKTQWESKALLELHEKQLLFNNSLASKTGFGLICWAYFILCFIILHINWVLSFPSMTQISLDLKDNTLCKNVLNFILRLVQVTHKALLNFVTLLQHLLDAFMAVLLAHLGGQVAEPYHRQHLQALDVREPYLTVGVHHKVNHNLFDFNWFVDCLEEVD